MKKNTKVVLTQKWWKDNKSKTLIGKGNLGKTLSAFESALKLAVVAKGAEKGKRIKAALKLCKELDTAAAKNAKACMPKIHADTKYVLQNSFPAEVEKLRKTLTKLYKDLEKHISSLSITQVIKDKTYRVHYMAMAKKRFNDENIMFVLTAKKKNAAIYNEYIREGAPKQINIDHSLRVQFDKAMQSDSIGSAPWSKAVNVILSLIEINDMGPKFAKFVLDT